ncbi:MAG: hypothetical protein ABI812_06650 [Betaproteobacteria bacterium]
MDAPPTRSAHVPAPADRLDAPGGLRGQTPIGDPDDDDWEDDDLDDEDDEDDDEEPMQLARDFRA